MSGESSHVVNGHVVSVSHTSSVLSQQVSQRRNTVPQCCMSPLLATKATETCPSISMPGICDPISSYSAVGTYPYSAASGQQHFQDTGKYLHGLFETNAGQNTTNLQVPPAVEKEREFHHLRQNSVTALPQSLHQVNEDHMMKMFEYENLVRNGQDTALKLSTSLGVSSGNGLEVMRPPRPASMPSLDTSTVVTEEGHVPPRRKGRGGRSAAMDPRLDPTIDPKRAKRILANRQSAARSKNKQRGHLDSLEGAKNILARQKSVLLKELAWLKAEVQSMEEEDSKLQLQINVLREHSILQEALQIKLLEECGQSCALGDCSLNGQSSNAHEICQKPEDPSQ